MSPEIIIALKLLFVAVIAFVLHRITRRAIASYEEKNVIGRRLSRILKATSRWVFIISAIIISLQVVGISIAAVWASLSALLVMVAVGFIAVWSVLSNASCALILVVFAPFQIGDEIELIEPSLQDPGKSGLKGKVIDITLLYTTLLESGREDGLVTVRIPNNQFFQKAIRCHRGKDTKTLKEALFESPVN